MLTFNVILGYQGSYSERSCNFLFKVPVFFFQSDRPTDPMSGSAFDAKREKRGGGGVGGRWPSLFPTRVKDRLVVGTARISCKTKHSGLHDRKTEHFKAITSSNHQLLKTMCGQLVITWNFEILAKGRWDSHCKIRETLLIRNFEPSPNENISSEKLYLF